MKVPAGTVGAIEELLRDQTVVSKPNAPSSLPVSDADDEWVLASAIAGRAGVLVTGDADLLDIAAEAPVRIVDPRTLWEMIRGQRPKR